MTAEKKEVSRRSFLNIGATAVVAGVVAGAAGYYAGMQSVPPGPPGATVTQTTTVTGAATTVAGAVLGKKLKMAILVPGRANDFGWNQQGVEGLRQTAQRFRAAEFSFSEGLGYGEAPIRAMEDYIRKEFDLVVCHAGGYGEFAMDYVKQGKTGNTKILFNRYAEKKEELLPNKMASYLFEAHVSTYPAGYLAGLMTKKNVVGLVQSVETDTNWLRQSAAFAQGLKAANPRAKLLFAIVGSYEDPAKAKEFTLAQIGLGADVIACWGDGTSFGAMDAASENGVWFIDDIGDKRAIDTKGILLTSVIWDFSVPYDQAVIDIYAGEFGTTWYHQTSANRGSYLMELNPKVPPDVVAKVDAEARKVQAGQTQVKLVDTADDLHALFRELGYE